MILAFTTATWLFILIPLLVVYILGIADIVRSATLTRSAKAAWILIVVLLPVMGTIAYFALRRPSEKEIEQVQAATQERPPRQFG